MQRFKKLLVYLCALSLLISALYTSVSANTSNTNWDGTVAENFAGGDGSAENPFMIANAEQLAKCVTYGGTASVGKYFKLANDIVINSDFNSNPINWYESDLDNVTDDRTFSGIFDGNGHYISGLYYSGNGRNVGLFPITTEKTRIKNLGMTNVSITGPDYAGAVTGFLSVAHTGWKANGYSDKYPSIVNSHIADDVVITANHAGAFAGCIVNMSGSSYVSIDNCSIHAKLNGSIHEGFEAGNYWKNATDFWIFITNVFTTTPVNQTNTLLKGDNIYTSVADERFDWFTVIDDEELMIGEEAKYQMENLNFNAIWRTNDNAYPTLRVFSGDAYSIWGGAIDQTFSGNGTAESPYLINTADELAGLVTLGKTVTTGKYYRLTTNVDISAARWYISNNDGETNVFNGTFDGAGHVVSGMNYYEGTGKWASGGGLFPAISDNAHISSVGITNMNADRWGSQNALGAIFGYAKLSNSWDSVGGGDFSTAYPTIEYCFADETAVLKGGYVGGIGGTVTSANNSLGYIRISNCYFAGSWRGCDGNASIGNIYNATAFVHNFYTTKSLIGVSNANIKYYNSYSTITGETNSLGGQYLTEEQITGSAAAENLSDFDFNSIWETVDDGMPKLKVFNSNTVEQNVQSYNADGGNGIKYVVRNSLPGVNVDNISAGIVTAKVNGVVKAIEEIGILIGRADTDVLSLETVNNDPITGYKVVGYNKENIDFDKLKIDDSSVIFSAVVNGTQQYNAKLYIIFTDGTVKINDVNTNTPTENGSADGYLVDDLFEQGDANFDRAVDILDLVRLKKYKAGMCEYKEGTLLDIVDIDSDNKFDATDLAEFRKALLLEKKNDSTEYSLIWSDEFDSQSLNTDKWSFNGDMGGYSDMPTEYGSNVQSIEKNDKGESYLHLSAIKYGTQYRTVKSVTTKESMGFQYGYVEMRAKVPTGQGIWPSLWMKELNPGENYRSEIDIVEVIGSNVTSSHLHKWYNEGGRDSWDDTQSYVISDNDWHTYGMLWTPEEITIYVDGVKRMSYDLTENFGNGDMSGFKTPMYLIINNHIITEGYTASEGGAWAKGREVPADFTESVYDIDYIRLYQTKDCEIVYQ